MVLAVHLNLDQTASDRVREIWWALAADGINDFMLAAEDAPHISLAIYVEADVSALIAAADAFAARADPLPVTLSSVVFSPAQRAFCSSLRNRPPACSACTSCFTSSPQRCGTPAA